MSFGRDRKLNSPWKMQSYVYFHRVITNMFYGLLFPHHLDTGLVSLYFLGEFHASVSHVMDKYKWCFMKFPRKVGHGTRNNGQGLFCCFCFFLFFVFFGGGIVSCLAVLLNFQREIRCVVSVVTIVSPIITLVWQQNAWFDTKMLYPACISWHCHYQTSSPPPVRKGLFFNSIQIFLKNPYRNGNEVILIWIQACIISLWNLKYN